MAIARRTWSAATLAIAAGALISGCQSGHGEYTEEFRAQAEARMAQVRAGTSWDMAKQMFLAGDLDKALRIVDQSLAIASHVPKSHTLRGRILFEQGRFDDALQSFQTSIEIDPEFVEAYYYAGIVHERFSEYDLALNNFSAAAEGDPTNPQYLVAAAEMHIQRGELQDARDMLDAAAGRFQHNAGVRQTLGHISMMQGEVETAAELFGEACLLAPDDISLVEDLARAQVAAGNYADAEYSLGQLLREDDLEGRRDIEHLRARCLVALDRPVEARSIYSDLTKDERGQNDFEAWNGLGEVALTLQDDGRLREAASRLIALDSSRPEGFLFMAMLQRSRGDLQRAADTLDRAIKLGGGSSEPAVLQSIIYDELGDRRAAINSAKLALQLDPSNAHARRLLRSLTSVAGVSAD